jgi:DNA-binding NarL/FixJ family response regulator
VATPEESGAAVKSRVFVVDDHPLVREWLTSLLNQQHDLMVCGEADDAPQALNRIVVARPDVAVIDISLKTGSGLELIKQMKSSHPNVAIVVLSMHDESLYAERALRAGASGYVVKRDTPKKVVAAIRRVLDGQLYVSERFAALMTERFVKGRRPVLGSPVEQLSDRELEIFDLLGVGTGTRQISENLGVSIKTVQAYCARIKEKLHLQNATELLREAIRWQQEKNSG